VKNADLPHTEGARILSGKLLSEQVIDRVKARVLQCRHRGVTPCLAVVLVGDDPASHIYVRNKEKRARECGISTVDHRLDGNISTADVLALVHMLNDERSVHGILVQLPLPRQVDAERVLLAIDPHKDVDGFHPDNLGLLLAGHARFVACTPKGCMRLLHEAGVALAGLRALVVGRSNIVGKPMAALLMHADATVTVAHSRTRDLADEVRHADVLVAAMGRPHAIRGEWIRPGAVVIDVGMNRLPDGKVVGDVELAGAVVRAAAITPVPGGVGPMTIACLMENCVEAAERFNSTPD